MTPALEEELLQTIEEAAEPARIGRQHSLRSELLSIAAAARTGKGKLAESTVGSNLGEIMAPASKKPAKAAQTSPISRLRQLVPLIESLSPELRDIVVQQIEALVSLVNLLEKYRTAGRPKAARARRRVTP